MIFLLKLVLFVISAATTLFLYNLGSIAYRSILVISSLNFVIALLIYYLIGFDLLSIILLIILFGIYVFIFYQKYIRPQEDLGKKIDLISAEIDKEKNQEKIIQHILDINISTDKTTPLIKFFKEIANFLLSEKQKFSRMQKMFILLTNFARYSFSEQDKEKLIKELSNMISYTFPEKKFWVIKQKDIQTSQVLGPNFDEEDLSNIRMGKLEGKTYTSFPILENGSAFAYIIIKNGSINEYEKLFFYLISKFSESVIKRIDREKEIEIKAITDPLTELYNRRYLVQHLEQAFAKFRRLGNIYSLAIFDIDGFKKINDNYGHYVGDEILREFSKILKSSVRAYDIPARFGGDEFVLFLDGTSKDDAVNVAKRIAKKFSDFSPSREMIKENLSVSWGLATINEAPGHFEDIIKLADKRLIKSKLSGKGKGSWE
ncbi:MAG: GGDEF domain-containing protein [Candidatus Calescibacterium sp.]|nr:GGDEF domain-containing protein [Candidatus Calescibacterium sp.]MCX7734275.1 GGDEF domain-containing protein [bacterium]MDW8087106.1 GGDEF domain-containing protein [Candidatus Calescibacterium sp.]